MHEPPTSGTRNDLYFINLIIAVVMLTQPHLDLGHLSSPDMCLSFVNLCFRVFLLCSFYDNKDQASCYSDFVAQEGYVTVGDKRTEDTNDYTFPRWTPINSTSSSSSASSLYDSLDPHPWRYVRTQIE